MTIAHLGNLPRLPEQRGGDPRLLFDEVMHLIRERISQAPRTLQQRIGPSEIGQPCSRLLGHKLAGTLPPERGDKWRAQVGTGVHEMIEDWLREANRQWRKATGDDGTRFLIEQPVNVGQIGGVDIIGRCDVFDRVTATQIDWKTASVSRLKHYRAHGPGRQYVDQAMLYAKGWAARGITVDTVMLIWLPRDGELKDAFYWSAPYAPEIAAASLARATRIDTAVKVLGAEAYTITNGELVERGLGVLADPALAPFDDESPWAPRLALPLDFDGCRYCPLWKPGATDPSTGCPGDSADRAPRRDALLDLIA